MTIVTRYPSSDTAVSGTWTTPTNVQADDGSTAAVTSAASKNVDAGIREQGGFGFDAQIPSGSTINSVTLEVEHMVSTASGIANLSVLARLGTTDGTAQVDTAEPTTLTARTYSVTRPGGGSWTRDDLLDGTLKTRIRGYNGNSATAVTYSWDYVRVKVDYTEAGTTPYRTEVLADSPLVYLRLGEASGTTAVDEQAAHDGTYVNTPTLGAAGAVASDTAVTFDRTASERVDWTTLGTFGQSLLTASFEFWIKTSDTTNQAAVFGSFNTGTTLAAQVLLNSNNTGGASSGSTYFYLRTEDGLQFQASIATNIYDGAWHHVVWVVESNTTHSVYVDGVSQTLTYNLTQWPASPTLANFGFALALAARNLRGTVDLYAAVSLDEVAFYTGRLTSTRVQAHYNARNVVLPLPELTMAPIQAR